jgi:hypothetical protein
MGTSLPLIVIVASLTLAGAALRAETAPEPDVLILSSGEKLIGQLVSSTGTAVKFKSNALGVLTFDWSKVKEFHSGRRFAVVPKDVNPRKPEGIKEVVHGTVSMTDQKLQVSGNVTTTVPVNELDHVVDDPTFQKAVESQPDLLTDWKGTVTGGIALVLATQDSRTFTGSANFVRAIPAEDWLAPRDRTSVNLSLAYGDATQPGEPSLVTSIYHADAERDEYLSDRWFAFGLLAYDHNYGQGLDLGQDYGGGVGWTVLKNANESLDLKGSASYIRRNLSGQPADNLAGATVDETFNRKFAHGLIFSQQLTMIGALNQADAYSAAANAKVVMPVYKRLNFSVSATDNILGDPPPGFRKNSFLFTTGVTYAVK